MQTEGLLFDAKRFLSAGVVNTLATLALYQVLVIFLSPSTSYAICWTAGLCFVLAFYPKHVFPGGRQDYFSRALILIAYILGFVLGLTIIRFVTSYGGHERLAIVFAVVATTLFNFSFIRAVVRYQSDGK